MLIEVWSDGACPSGYVGKKRLATAIAQFAHNDVEVVFKSFMLNTALTEQVV